VSGPRTRPSPAVAASFVNEIGPEVVDKVGHQARIALTRESSTVVRQEWIHVYAIVKTGGKQYKVAVGDVVTVEKLDAETGASVALPAILLVDGETVTTDATDLAKVSVTGEVLAQVKGPKIRIHKFKNKTGYHKRIGHRQKLSQIKVTSIESGKK
jgi:large subunit ribosomal protein L21